MSMKLSEMENHKAISLTIVPRPYQLELLSEIKKSNTILYLPTGSGKTYIATMLIKEKGDSLNKPLSEGRKWTILLVQSVPLVEQHANNLKRHLPWNIGTFSGDMNVDFWSAEQWTQITNKCHILIMTAQIYVNNLHHGYMNINDANLIIFDECHHAVSSHPFSQVMKVYHENQNQASLPHILGLTATLINSNSKNIKEDLSKLQKTLNATIKTTYDENIQIFSAHPEELIELYNEYVLDNELLAIVDHMESFRLMIKMIKSPVQNESIVEDLDTYYLECLKEPFKVIANYFLDIEVILKDNGVYAAFLATWHYTIEIEKKKKKCADTEKFNLLSLTLSEVTIVRKMLHNYMKKKSTNIENSSYMLVYASPKLELLMRILSNIKNSDSCLVFVDRRTTAKMLYHYIEDYIHVNQILNISCNFIVGTSRLSAGVFSSKEHAFKKKKNNDIIKRFNENRINVLITSEVLEEGIDIQTCNYVIRYDNPKHFPSYVQSKGRARSSGSKFIVMVTNPLQFEKIRADYSKMEIDIENVLKESDIDDDSIEDHGGEIFKTEQATLTYDIAISIVNRYCISLPQDCFTCLQPEWYIAQNNKNCTNKFKYKLLLPLNSAIKTPIDGIFCSSKKSAKKSAAYYACIELYNKGVLDENLLPISLTNKSIFNHSKWFPFWDDKDIEASDAKLKPGTNKMKRIVHIERPSFLYGTYPQPNKSSYLHVIHCVPKYEQLKDSTYKTFDKLLKSNKGFGILTSNKLPNVSKFPIFLHFGDVDVHVEVNVDKICICDMVYEKLEQFHTKLFLDILGVKKFVVRCYSNDNKPYLIIPINCSDGAYKVDWDVVNINTFVENEIPSMEKRKSKYYFDHLEMFNVISPWYRNILPAQRYIVTDVYYDMTPESTFSSSEYETFGHYFKDKYSIDVVDTEQPMIKVKSLGVSKINYLTPRLSIGKLDKREFIEVLVPEFCMWHMFPSVYWLKALMLPTILYRLSQLLLAEDLLIKINSKCNIEVENKPKGILKMDNFCGFNEVNKPIILPISDTLKYFTNSSNNLDNEWNSNDLLIDIDRQQNVTLLDVYNYLTFMNFNVSENNDDSLNINSENESEEQDLEKKNSDDVHVNLVCKKSRHAIYDLEQLEEINKLMKQPMPPSNTLKILKELNIFKSNICTKIEDLMNTSLTTLNELNFTGNEPPVLNSLVKQHLGKKNIPNQSDILKVITPPLANDMFNYERMETYGDSFLKFATSIVLFDVFESENEGVLTEIKMKLVGNRNLFYVGKNLNIGSYLMVNVFDPTMDWMAPCFDIPQQLKEIISTSGLPSDVLHEIVIPKDDQFSGNLSDETWVSIETELMKFKDKAAITIPKSDIQNEKLRFRHSLSDIFMEKQSVSDKMIADCVESLIGIYVYKSGFEEGFKILRGIGILPQEYIDVYKSKPIQNYEAFNSLNYSHILPGYQILENRIGYRFKHKHLLVQALTHPTYQREYITECYQRLEFLGDAILDFLITTYIIEHCKNKTPGEITDIRSSLVNNITFASLSARIGLHRFLLAESVTLTEAIDRFYQHQQKNNHKIGQEVLYLIEETDCLVAKSVDVPKVLGDLFESLIAAIYLDCGKDLNFVWKMCYKFMENEIIEFCTNVPKNPIRLLHETKLQPIFSKPPAAVQASTKGLKSMIQLDIIVHNKNITIYGFGQNKKEAKVAAAKMALRNMNKFVTS